VKPQSAADEVSIRAPAARYWTNVGAGRGCWRGIAVETDKNTAGPPLSRWPGHKAAAVSGGIRQILQVLSVSAAPASFLP